MTLQYSDRRDYLRRYYREHRKEIKCKTEGCKNKVTTGCSTGYCFGCRRKTLFNLGLPLNKFSVIEMT